MTYWKKNFRMTQFFNQAFVVLDNKKDWSGYSKYGGFAPPESISFPDLVPFSHDIEYLNKRVLLPTVDRALEEGM